MEGWSTQVKFTTSKSPPTPQRCSNSGCMPGASPNLCHQAGNSRPWSIGSDWERSFQGLEFAMGGPRPPPRGQTGRGAPGPPVEMEGNPPPLGHRATSDQLTRRLRRRRLAGSASARWSVLTNELKRYEYAVTAGGAITYNAPAGFLDDCVIALALANKARHAFSHTQSIAVFLRERRESVSRASRSPLVFQ